jgi:hypothetical protein
MESNKKKTEARMESNKATSRNTTHNIRKMSLDALLVKNLVQDIEASGKTRKEFNLPQLVEAKRHTYGEAGTTKRRAVQKKFDQIVRKSPKVYQKFLDKLQVNSGEGLKRELRASDSSDNSESSESSESGSVSDESSAISKKAASNRSARPPKPPSISRRTAQPETQPRTPPREVAFRTTPFLSPTTTTTTPFLSPTTMFSAASSVQTTESSVVAAVLQQVEALSHFKMDGSSDHPYIIIVDLNKPEANWGFEVSFVQQIEHRNFSRDIYHIRKVTGVPQDGEWEATIPFKKYPSLANRAVLIRGPSQDYWHQDPERYHAESFCEQTKKAHESLQTHLDANKERLYSNWLLVFPEGTQLENHILSDDASHVKKGTLDLVGSYQFLDDKSKMQDVELFGMDVHWRVAVKGGEMIRSPNAPKKKRFATRKK